MAKSTNTLTIMPCPKCGHPAPTLEQLYAKYYSDGDEVKERCIVWVAGRNEYTESLPCRCMVRKVGLWTGRIKKYYDKDCEECKGTGEVEPHVIPALPDKLSVTCPACLHVRDVKPLDAEGE